MTIPNLRVTPAELRAGADRCDKRGAEILAQLESLRSYVASLDPHWGGTAAASFHDLMRTWHTLANNLNDALNGTARGIRYDADHYSTNEHANNSRIATLDESLPKIGNNPDLPPSRF
jgi:WXG100 family type VII secretion target